MEDWHDMNDEDLEGTLWPILPRGVGFMGTTDSEAFDFCNR